MIKLFGTVGPACSDFDTLRAMYSQGMNGVRLNLSHSSLLESEDLLDTVRRAAEAAGKKPGIMIDMCGPELRLGSISVPFFIYAGDSLPVDSLPLPVVVTDGIIEGDRLLIDDGKLLLSYEGSGILRVINGGLVSGRKSVAVQGREFITPAVTDTDRENLRYASHFGVEYVMQPFVRGKGDLEELRSAMKDCGAENLPIFAKIENRTGLNKLREIADSCDELVIARGDLGNAVALWELPAVQKHIAKICRSEACPFMVVTQMLSSMENSPVPTRAEVSDIFNAVLDGAASVMVTGETAVGKYPVEVIKYLYNTVCSALEYSSRL